MYPSLEFPLENVSYLIYFNIFLSRLEGVRSLHPFQMDLRLKISTENQCRTPSKLSCIVYLGGTYVILG